MQYDLFERDEAAAGAAVVTPTPRPQSPPLSAEEAREVRARAEGTVVAHRGVFRAIHTAAARHFGEVTAGKAYRRSPALRITLRDPAAGPDDVEHHLMVSPEARTSRGRCDVHPDRVTLTLVRCLPGDCPGTYKPDRRLNLGLRPDRDPAITLHYPRNVDVDAARLCRVAARFVADPAAAVAASGTHCSFCSRPLTDPESRRRGIGPECFSKFGDFLRRLIPLDPEAAATT